MGSWLTDESLINLVPRIICIIRTNESYAYCRTVPTAGEKCLLAPVGQYNSILLSILPPTMINGSTKDRDGSTKASSGSESSLRKFTLSCSRCRTMCMWPLALRYRRRNSSSSCRWNASSVRSAIFAQRMNVSRGRKGQRWTTIPTVLPRCEFCSLIPRTMHLTGLHLHYKQCIAKPGNRSRGCCTGTRAFC